MVSAMPFPEIIRTFIPIKTVDDMKKKLVFATNNAHKLDEVRQILGER